MKLYGLFQHIFGYSLVSVVADFISAMLIRATGQSLQRASEKSLKSLGLGKLLEDSGSYLFHAIDATTSFSDFGLIFPMKFDDSVVPSLYSQIFYPLETLLLLCTYGTLSL